MSRLPVGNETMKAAYFRSITDEEAEAQLRHPRLWSYIARDPRGVIFAHGLCKTRSECEFSAIKQAGEYAERLLIARERDHTPWVGVDGWRFVVWPPTEKRDPALSLSATQVDVLLQGLKHKLDRSRRGWCYDDGVSLTDSASFYRPGTIKSLHSRGLLDANFTDMRVYQTDKKARNFDGSCHSNSPGSLKFQVWTSALGEEALRQKGLLPDGDQLVYH